ncbi:RRM domain-containing protein [Aphelenchoides besseyi]|nr:RRM domain-containing protein [Aphelenchoides besseyi]KAI6207736.1 RRM domain-containing protein [Aphelenchoides besseyi]
MSATESTIAVEEAVNGDVVETATEETPMEGTEDFGDINERIKQIEEEAKKIREMQLEFNTSSTSTNGSSFGPTLSQEEKAAIDNRSVFVDYSAKPDQLEEHFRGCGAIERVTILADKFSGHPKGFAYIEFTEPDGKQNALALNESLFLGRQIKVTEKRTNKPGISTTNRPPRGRGRRAASRFYPGFRGRARAMRRRAYQPY